MSTVCGYCETDIDPIDNVDGYCSKRCKYFGETGWKPSFWHENEEIKLIPRQILLLDLLYDAINENDYSCAISNLDNVVSAICGNPKAAIEFAKYFLDKS